MRSLRIILMLTAATSALPGCTSVDPQPGQLGGPCRASLTPCDPGLICNGNGCQETGGGDDRNIGVSFSFREGKTGVEADGKDNTILVARFAQVSNGLPEPPPENLQFRMWVDPPEAGTLEFDATANPEVQGAGRVPYRIIDANGAATARFTGCNKEVEGCVAFANIRVAVAPDVLVPIDSVSVENIGAIVVPVDPENPEDPEEPVVPTPPLPDGFGPANRCSGADDVVYLEGTETSQVFRGDGMTFAVDSWQSFTTPQNGEIARMVLRMNSQELGSEISFIITAEPMNTTLLAQEYDNATSTEEPADGAAGFQFSVLGSPYGSQCSRHMERRFEIQALEIEGGTFKRIALSFVSGCDGGIISGCFNVVSPF